MMNADIVFCAAIAVMIVGSLYAAPRIVRDRIDMQWGLDGKPTWSAPKALDLWGVIVFALALRAVIWAAMTWTPDRVHGAELGIVLMSIIVALSHLYVLMRAAKAA
ncbi:hypothetical protein RPMA_20385 [Tardiphaga alba]|uniref:DUF1648 domain-containing protein n=1 Tax=Tardiphaga alba TaxID=340268 RepID=A0ABX8AAY7_9BRAD|nr:hypothetical protein [Tardiphaga alba]QUS40934.1 hypothetical protein RPMA_20385 [Tardiphaga alba]